MGYSSWGHRVRHDLATKPPLLLVFKVEIPRSPSVGNWIKIIVVYLYTSNREEVHSVVHTDPVQQHGGVSKALCHIEVVKHKIYKIL